MKTLTTAFLCAVLLGSCATRISEEEAQRRSEEAFTRAFADSGRPDMIAPLEQDDVQRLCSKYRNEPPQDVAEKIEKSQAATIEFPPSAKMMGDWRLGEKIAQDGYGLRFTDDDSKRPNGGNCYACHQLSPQELSYGTLGPSLSQFGRKRGASEALQRYVFARIYNPQAFAACSNMPRFGYHRVLTPEQISHVVALLLDPDSPVNK